MAGLVKQPDDSLRSPRFQTQTVWRVSDQHAAPPSSLPLLSPALVGFGGVSSFGGKLAATVEARGAIMRKGEMHEEKPRKEAIPTFVILAVS